MNASRNGGFFDGYGARLVAGLVLAAALGLLVLYNRDILFPPPPPPATAAGQGASGNAELAACLKERLGAVDRMRAEGVVSGVRFSEFRARAEAYCIGQFGEGGPPAPMK